MPIARDDLVRHLDLLLDAGRFAAVDGSRNGLQVEGGARISRLATAADASLAAIRSAIAARADALLVHHGLLWGRADLRLTGRLAARVRTLFAADCSLLAYHLPLDAHATWGNNAWLADRLGLTTLAPFGDARGQSIGCIGSLPAPLAADALARRLGEAVDHAVIHCPAQDGPQGLVSRVAVIAGAGPGYLDEALAAGAQALITGTADEQHFNDAGESPIHLLAAGHHATECQAIHRLGAHLAATLGLEHLPMTEHNPL